MGIWPVKVYSEPRDDALDSGMKHIKLKIFVTHQTC